MSDESKSVDSLTDNSAVQLRLISLNGMILRILKERVSVKLGRQVRTAQEKLQAQAQAQNQNNNNPAESIGDGELNARPDTTLDETMFHNSSINTPAEEMKAPVDKLNNTDECAVWFKSKVVSRAHAEIWLKDGQVYLRDVGSSSGTFLNKMRLSPANKMSRPYPLRQGDLIQLGVDYQGRTEEIYKAVELQVSIDLTDLHSKLKKEIPMRFRYALNLLVTATNPYAARKEQDSVQDNSVDCCICISEIGPFQAIFIAPCSHCFHYKCIQHILRENIMFPCPVCRQVANLEASVSMESIVDYGKGGWKRQANRSKSSLLNIDGDLDLQPHFTHRPHFGLEFTHGLRNEIPRDYLPATQNNDIPENSRDLDMELDLELD